MDRDAAGVADSSEWQLLSPLLLFARDSRIQPRKAGQKQEVVAISGLDFFPLCEVCENGSRMSAGMVVDEAVSEEGKGELGPP